MVPFPMTLSDTYPRSQGCQVTIDAVDVFAICWVFLLRVSRVSIKSVNLLMGVDDVFFLLFLVTVGRSVKLWINISILA